MKPAKFEEANVTVLPPEGVEGDGLPIWKGKLPTGQPVIVSSWEISDEELVEIVRTRRVWFLEWGEEHHPMTLAGIKPLESRPMDLSGPIEPGADLGKTSIILGKK